MLRVSDPPFLVGTGLVAVALVLAAATVIRGEVPVLGGGAAALLAVAVVGMAGCAVGGISQAPTVGWTAPTIVLGTVLGIAALALILAGLFEWRAVLQPIGAVLSLPAESTPAARIAVVGLAAVIAAKWLIATGMAVFAR